jgi:hypothetical protein
LIVETEEPVANVEQTDFRRVRVRGGAHQNAGIDKKPLQQHEEVPFNVEFRNTNKRTRNRVEPTVTQFHQEVTPTYSEDHEPVQKAGRQHQPNIQNVRSRSRGESPQRPSANALHHEEIQVQEPVRTQNRRVVQSRRRLGPTPQTNFPVVTEQNPTNPPPIDYELANLKRQHEYEIQKLNDELDKQRIAEEKVQRDAQEALEQKHSKKREELLALQNDLDEKQKVLQEERNFVDNQHKQERQELVDKIALQKKARLEDYDKKRKALEKVHQAEIEKYTPSDKRKTFVDI